MMNYRIGAVSGSLVILVALAGCGNASDDSERSQAPLFQTDAATAVTIRGQVLFTGEPPQPARIDLRREPSCQEFHPEGLYSQQLVVNPNQTLRNVFVWVKEGLEDFRFATPEEAVRIDQQGCRYTPHVLGVQVGQRIEWSNSDPVDHNVHPIPKENYEWNRTQRAGAAPITLQYDKPELMILVKCNLHPWMSGYVNVAPHPFFAVSDEQGRFQIAGLPPGDYVLEAVHETLGSHDLAVTVRAGEDRELEFTFP